MKLTFISVICFLMILPIFSQEEDVKENVSVEWWVMPLFSVDKKGKPVVDLKPEDIRLWVNQREISGFSFFKRSFTAQEKKIQEVQEKALPPIEKKRTIFLLFDTALTGKKSVSNSKTIAKEIVRTTGNEHEFIVMTISPAKGLRYLGGPVNNKNHILNIIEKKVKINNNSGPFSIPDAIEEMNLMPDKYSGDEIRKFLLPQKHSVFRYKAKNFFESFESLYYSINSLTTNKFVYLFTEGISEDAQVVEKNGKIEYRFHLSRVAQFLSRSGTVLFIIDGGGYNDSRFAVGSGKESLKFLAKESGGKYFKGTKKKVVESIQNVHRAYYEIAFPDLAEFKGNTRDIIVKAKKKGIRIHTLKTLEKSKTYAEMNQIEREVLALNLIQGNPLTRTLLTSRGIKIEKTTKNENKMSFQVIIPGDFLHNRVDVLKVRLNNKTGEPVVERQSTIFKTNKTKITFDNLSKNTSTYFAIIHKEKNIALIKGRTRSSHFD